jgi:hypothetical protein
MYALIRTRVTFLFKNFSNQHWLTYLAMLSRAAAHLGGCIFRCVLARQWLGMAGGIHSPLNLFDGQLFPRLAIVYSGLDAGHLKASVFEQLFHIQPRLVVASQCY